MKVLVQYWLPLRGGELVSISLSQEQLTKTISELVPKQNPEDKDEILNEDSAANPDGDAEELEIPDSTIERFLDLLNRRTVFLCDDEMGMIWDNLPR